MDLSYFFELFLTSFIFSFFAFPVFIRILEKYQILESPNVRKVHKHHTPSLGGVPIFIGILATFIIWWPAEVIGQYKIFLGALSLMFIIGLKDDVIPLKATQKLVGQLIPIALIVVSGLALIPSFYGMFGESAFWFPLSVVISMFALVVIINSINLIDGADGLASGLGLLIITLFAIWFYLVGQLELSIMSMTFIGAFLAFLFFNWHPSKIFMGDTGALILGFIIAFLAINFMNVNHGLPINNPYRFNATITTTFCILFVPLFDTLRVFIIRVNAGVSPFKADKKHIHHVLMRLGFSHSRITVLLVTVNACMVMLAVSLRHLSDLILLPIVMSIAIGFSILLHFFITRKLSRTEPKRLKTAL